MLTQMVNRAKTGLWSLEERMGRGKEEKKRPKVGDNGQLLRSLRRSETGLPRRLTLSHHKTLRGVTILSYMGTSM